MTILASPQFRVAQLSFRKSMGLCENARAPLLPVDFYNDTGVQMAPSPVFPLPFAALSRQATILIVPFLQVTAVSAIFLVVVHMVVAAVPIIISFVATVTVIVVGLCKRDRKEQGRAQQESTQVTFHVVIAPVRTSPRS